MNNIGQIMPNWITSRAKSIERKCLNKFGRSLSFTGIEMILRDGAVISIDIETKVITIDKDKYKENKEKYLKEVGLK